MKLSFVFISFVLIAAMIVPAYWYFMQEPKKEDGLFVINVLDKQVYEDSHIKGSMNVTIDELELFAQKLDKERAEIVVYCSNYMCTTSDFVAKKLRDAGFKNVWVYEGGMAEWYQLGLPVEGPSNNAYLTKKVEKPVAGSHVAMSITAHDLERKMSMQIAKQAAA